MHKFIQIALDTKKGNMSLFFDGKKDALTTILCVYENGVAIVEAWTDYSRKEPLCSDICRHPQKIKTTIWKRLQKKP